MFQVGVSSKFYNLMRVGALVGGVPCSLVPMAGVSVLRGGLLACVSLCSRLRSATDDFWGWRIIIIK